jgi:parallel beta-helix repeat protein
MKNIYKRFTKKTFLAILIVHFSMLSFAATYYVSNTGNDSNSGLTTSLAWRTLAKVNATTFKAGDQILFQKGDAFYGAITIKNSGTSGSPITFSAYGTGENPIITGFTTVTSWTNLGSNIWESTNAVSTLSTCNMVVINGVNSPMGRYPNSNAANSGYVTFQSHSGTTSITSSGLSGTPNWTGAELVIRSSQWILDRMAITNQSVGTLTYGTGINNEPTNGYGFFIQNDSRTLDVQNEWYYNPTTKKLQIYSNSQPENVQVASVKDLVTYNGNYITFDNITLMGANRYAFVSDWTTNHTIQNCSILFSGVDAVNLAGCSHFTFNNNTISDSNSGGLNLYYGDSYATITNNTIQNIGTIAGMGRNGEALCNYTAIFLSPDCDNSIVTNNIITNIGYNGITFNGNSTVVENNLINSFCNVLQDGAGIYTVRGEGTIKTNMVVTGNIVLNAIGAINGTNSGISHANGIYTDDNTRNVEIKNNTIANCGGDGFYIHNSSYVTITGNTVFNNRCQLNAQKDATGSDLITNCIITDNKFISKAANQYVFHWWMTATVKDIGKMDNNIYARPIDDNIVFFDENTYANYTFSQWRIYMAQDANSKQSPQAITSESDLQFEYNATTSAKTITLSRAMIDVKGTKYATSLTLQPFTSVVLMKDLTAAVVPGTPTSPLATAGNASASVTFLAPSNNGSSVITGYTVTSIPAGGIDSNAGSTSLTHILTGLTNGISYTFTVKASNSVGSSVASVASNSVTPKAPVATGFTFTGPTSGSVNSASSNFTVTPNNSYTGTITITPTGTGSAGLSAKVLSFSNSSTAQNFTIVPTVAGNITLTATNNGTLTNPSNLTYTVNAVLPDAPTSVVATAGDVSASVSFVAPGSNGGSAITGYTVTSIPSGGTDTNAGSTSLAHILTGLTNGTSYTFTVTATNSVGSSVASVASNSVVPVAANVITKQGEITSHFTTVWQGLNGLNHMNINVVSATLEDVPLAADDEIAVFSGSLCVGAQKLSTSIISSDNTSFLTILASQSDGSNNGFIDNDTIVFKIWNNKTQSESQINAVVYRNDVSTWKTTGKYSAGATAVVEIASYKVYTQSISLLKGYNMISTYVSAQNPNVTAVTKTLLDQGNLIKMQDQTGNSYENWGDYGGWVNNLGSLEKTEGYKIQVANNCTLQVTGRPISLPLEINLKTGWNIISYPRTDMIDAMAVVQSLIDQNTLVKVQDEAGNSIENWGLYGGWKNGIGNFIPGKAYKVKMNADAVLTFQENYTKSAVVIVQPEETEYYHSSVEGNGTDQMNINIANLNSIGISEGDELAAFDGKVCVGTAKINEANLLSGTACLVSSFSTDDQNPNGFKVGDPVQISTWSKLNGNESIINAEIITGQMKYEKNASVLVKMKSATLVTGISNLSDMIKIDVFPNPCQGKVTVRFSEIPEANSRIEISDLSGRKLISRLISGTSEEFNLDFFTSGLYLVRSILGSNEYIQKLIVNK